MARKRTRSREVAGMVAMIVAFGAHGRHGLAHADAGDDEAPAADDGSDDGSDDEGSADDDKDQPKVTANGNFLLKDFPLRETERPLTMIKGVTQVKLGLGTDISAKGAFASVGEDLDVAYGLRDNVTLLGGVDSTYNFAGFSAYAGFEGALKYDLLDIRVVANVHRNALPKYGVFCEPSNGMNEMAGISADGSTYTCDTANAQAEALPTGSSDSGDLQISVDVGFPFRYAFSDSIAIVALQSLIGINLKSAGSVANGLTDGSATSSTSNVGSDLCHSPAKGAGTGTMPATGTIQTCTSYTDGNKPDLEPSIGFLASPADFVSIMVQAQLFVPGFDTFAALQIPVSARVNVAANHKLDFGLEFTLLNVIPSGDDASAFDNRFVSLYGQARF